MTSPSKQSPLHYTATQRNASFAPVAGWQVPQRFGDPAAELDLARNRVGLADTSARGKLLIDGTNAAKRLASLWSISELAVGQGAAIANGAVFRLRPSRYFVHTPPGGETAVTSAIETAADTNDLLAVTDYTHGWASLALIGPQSAELLSRLCGLDFHHSRFPNWTAKQSSVAKTNQLIVRQDAGETAVYYLIGARSLAAYLWQTIMAAGQDLLIVPIGAEAYGNLDSTS